MPVPKGKRYGGRQKGTPNKPKPYMQMLEQMLEQYIGETDPKTGATALMNDLLSLPPVARISAVEKFLNYCKPKKQAVQADITAQTDTTIEQTIINLL